MDEAGSEPLMHVADRVRVNDANVDGHDNLSDREASTGEASKRQTEATIMDGPLKLHTRLALSAFSQGVLAAA